jgi:hypothetical protein
MLHWFRIFHTNFFATQPPPTTTNIIYFIELSRGGASQIVYYIISIPKFYITLYCKVFYDI